MLAAAQIAPPTFKNASQLFAVTEREELKVVRVLDKTANLTNGHVLLRRYVDIPDGVYDISLDGTLIQTVYTHGLRYPDIDLVRPPFERMKPYCEIPNTLVGEMIAFCRAVKDVHGTVTINGRGVYLEQNPATSIPYRFNVTHTIGLDPKYLSIALIEMLQYPVVYLLQEGVQSPLIIGKDWGSCALIMPLKGY